MQTIIPPPAATAAPEGHASYADLSALHDRNVDMAKGFAAMVAKAEPAFRDTAEQFRALHARHADSLAQLLADLGAEVNPDGTLMGTVHTAVISVRAFFDDIDDDVMDQIRNGEESLLKSYDAAIAEYAAQGFVAQLRDMQAEVRALLTATQHLG